MFAPAYLYSSSNHKLPATIGAKRPAGLFVPGHFRALFGFVQKRPLSRQKLLQALRLLSQPGRIHPVIGNYPLDIKARFPPGNHFHKQQRVTFIIQRFRPTLQVMRTAVVRSGKKNQIVADKIFFPQTTNIILPDCKVNVLVKQRPPVFLITLAAVAGITCIRPQAPA